MNTNKFTSDELNVLFHVLNNSYGDAFDKAAERALECNDMQRETFIKTYSRLITKLVNADT